MRINDLPPDHKIGRSGQLGDSEKVKQGPRARVAPDQKASAHVPAPELERVVAALKEIPELRESMVAQLASRLANGEYLTPQAAERTAEAMVE